MATVAGLPYPSSSSISFLFYLSVFFVSFLYEYARARGAKRDDDEISMTETAEFLFYLCEKKSEP